MLCNNNGIWKKRQTARRLTASNTLQCTYTEMGCFKGISLLAAAINNALGKIPLDTNCFSFGRNMEERQTFHSKVKPHDLKKISQ